MGGGGVEIWRPPDVWSEEMGGATKLFTYRAARGSRVADSGVKYTATKPIFPSDLARSALRVHPSGAMLCNSPMGEADGVG